MTDSGDSVLRALTDDGGFRVITAHTTETVRDAIRAQKATGETAQHFGELLTGAILYRETMAPQLRVQGILQGAGGHGQLVADSRPDGTARGLVRLPEEGSLGMRGALLQMMRSLPNGDLHRGVVEVPESGLISDALMGYMQSSEQVISMISVGCRMRGDEVVAAGGYIVQILPELEEHLLAIMTERLNDFRRIDELFDSVASSPEKLMEELLWGMDHTLLERTSHHFECGCSEVRVMASLATLSRADIEDLMSDEEPLEISCDYCGSEYRVSPERLRGMLNGS